MYKKYFFYLLMIFVSTILSCRSGKQRVDLFIANAHVYTVDDEFSIKDCIVINDGMIIKTGTKSEMLEKYKPEKIIDLEGKYVYPGFIDAHCHFYNYALSRLEVDLSGTASFEEVLSKVTEFSNEHMAGWIKGRGWDQNDWEVKEFPNKTKLDSLFPDRPVLLIRVDGHAALANSAALKIAGITAASKVDGGIIELNENVPSGILIDNAIELVTSKIPKYSDETIASALVSAAQECFSVGLTTVGDAGLDKKIVHLIDSLQKAEKLKMKVYAMLNPTEENFREYMYFGRYKTTFLDVRSVKLFADGALGSRGACLLEPYADKPETYGIMVTSEDSLMKICADAYKYGYQVNTHAIGDSAVRSILGIYAGVLKDTNDFRWRIEHSQVVSPDDLEKFSRYNIIPSVNTVHATSDMSWAAERLGQDRVRTAYAYKDLCNTNGWLCNGSDFPVEEINPVYGFYAAVFRKDLNGLPEGGFQSENSLSRIEALKAMTIWAAKSFFEEREKGSIEEGKYADFIVLDKDILSVPEKEIPSVKVLMTFVNGEKVYESIK